VLSILSVVPLRRQNAGSDPFGDDLAALLFCFVGRERLEASSPLLKEVERRFSGKQNTFGWRDASN
jgi:hypothetical protein